MREQDLLNHIEQRSRSLAGRFGIVVPPGDDCAAIQTSAGIQLLTVDHLIEGRHYLPSATPEQIAHKAVARSVSDIAAMGGTPVIALATAAMKRNDQRANAIFDAMHEAALRMECPLVGGDIAMYDETLHEGAPTMFTVTVVGNAHPMRGPVLRSTATPDDGVYVTGKIGSSFKTDHHLTFTPRVREAKQLCDQLGNALHAMIDISDGLGIDAGRVAMASGVAIELDAVAIPLRVSGQDPVEAVGNGEDYELLLTANDEIASRLITDVPLTRIGRVVDGTLGTVHLRIENNMVAVHCRGWDHGV
ncbi:MAG: thiamine-monophosphate kinase [Phycisphaeraceae bacterium]|nr:thiamine-monophosphate kinase [Phycisphaeraceae bacterium]